MVSAQAGVILTIELPIGPFRGKENVIQPARVGKGQES